MEPAYHARLKTSQSAEENRKKRLQDEKPARDLKWSEAERIYREKRESDPSKGKEWAYQATVKSMNEKGFSIKFNTLKTKFKSRKDLP